MAATATPDVSTPIPQAPIAGQQGQTIPFRKATYERSMTIGQDVGVIGASQVILPRDVVGDGYMYAIIEDVSAASAGNGATVAVAVDDTPLSAIQRVQLMDVSGDLINLSGFENWIDNIINGQFAAFLPDTVAHTTLFAPGSGFLMATPTTGAGATAGTFSFMYRLTVGTGPRDLVGIVGNQSRTMKYQLINTLAPLTSIYSVSPNGTVTATIQHHYLNYAVPNDRNANGVPQEVFPPNYGVIHRVTSTTVEAPAASSTVTHFMKQVGNTIRAIGLIFRSGATAQPRTATVGFMPTQIIMKAGSATVYQESTRARQEKNLRTYGFDMPNGVLLFDFIHDADIKSGDEYGDDWLHSQLLSDLHFEVTYPAGAWGAGSSLTAITDELLNVA